MTVRPWGKARVRAPEGATPRRPATYLLLGAVEAGGCRPEGVLSAGSGLLRKDEHDAAVVLLAVFTGWFTRLKILPPVPGLPALRPFQARMAATGRSCLTASGVIH